MTAAGRTGMPGRQRGVLAATFLAGVFVVGSAPVHAQNPSGLVGQDGSDASEPTPRLPDGTPNLGRIPGEKGAWAVPYVTNMAARVVSVDGNPVTAPEAPSSSRGPRGGSAAERHIPFVPWSAALYDYNSANESKYDPEGYCMPPGGPRMMATPYPMEIIQLPEQERILMIFEGATHIWREIYLDGRPHPEGDALNPTFLGHSVGRWEGDTLVVDVVGFNETTWIDFFGHPHTDALHVVERFSRPDKNTLHYEATLHDPKAYTSCIPSFCSHQITPKTSRYTRCSTSMLPNVSINGRSRSSGQLGRWWYSISPCRNNECVRRFTVFAFNQRS